MNSNLLIKANVFIKNRLIEFSGSLLVLISIFLIISTASYTPDDPNFIYSPENVKIKNLGGFYGSVIADFLLQSIGLVSFFVTITILSWGFSLIYYKKINNSLAKIFYTLVYIILGTTFINIFLNNSFWLIDNGNGGFVGRIIKENIYLFSDLYDNQYIIFSILLLALIFFVLSLSLQIKMFFKIFLIPLIVLKKILKIFKKK